MAYTFQQGKLVDTAGKTVNVDSRGVVQPASLDLPGPLPEIPTPGLDILREYLNPLDAIGDVTDAAVTSGRAVIAAYKWIGDRDNWIRILKVVMGAALINIGAYMLIGKSASGAMSTVAKVVK
jgi:hypothetical protein